MIPTAVGGFLILIGIFFRTYKLSKEISYISYAAGVFLLSIQLTRVAAKIFNG
jgi:hypothetical protein